MTDIEQKALALVNEVRSPFSARQIDNLDDATSWEVVDALLRAIEKHEAFRQEVSDALNSYYGINGCLPHQLLARFIIAKPDPLVEALDEALWEVSNVKLTDRELRAVSLRLNAKCGGKIEGEG